MTVSTAVPNGYTVTSGTWNAFSGSTALGIGSAVAVLTDSSNNTYIRTSTSALFSPSQIWYDLTNPVLGGSALARMRVGAITKNGDGSGATINLLVAGVTRTWIGYPNTSTAATAYTGWAALSTAFSQTSGNAAQAYLESYGTAIRFTKLWVEYDYASIPTATPSVTAVNTTTPTVTWTFADGDGYTQASAVVKLFSSAQYSAAGFDAGTSTSLYTGTVIGTAASITPSTAVITTNGTVYKPFLQVFKQVDITSIPSAWTSATAASTASFTPPASPGLTAAWSSALSRVELTASAGTAPNRIVVFRGTALTDPNYQLLSSATYSDGTAQPRDYFVPRSTAIVYGAYQTTGTVTPFLQSAITYATVTTGSATTWELRSVDSPVTYRNLSLPVTGISFDQYEGQTVYRPIGSNTPIVVSGNIGGDDGSMTITTTSQATWDSIKAILDLQADLYLVAPFVDSNNLARRWFIRVTGRSWVESGIPSAQVRVATVSFVETAAPAVAAT